MMKKTIITSMVLAIGLIASPVMASEQNDIDYDSMSTEELVALRDEINAQIADRGGDNVLPQGVYEVGKDIKTGSFKISSLPIVGAASIRLYSSKEDYDSHTVDEYYVINYDEENDKQISSVFVNLSEGEIMEISSKNVIIEEMKASWMPEE